MMLLAEVFHFQFKGPCPHFSDCNYLVLRRKPQSIFCVSVRL